LKEEGAGEEEGEDFSPLFPTLFSLRFQDGGLND